MNSFKRKIAMRALQASDLAFLVLSFLLAWYVESHDAETISFGQFFSMRIKIQNFVIFSLFLVCWHILFAAFGLYHSKRLSSQWSEAAEVIRCATVGTIGLFVIGKLFTVHLITPVFLVTFWVGAASLTTLSRLVLRFFLQQVRLRGRNLRHILIVGTNARGVRFARKIEARPDLGYQLLGFVENGWSGNQEFRQSGYSVLVDFGGFPEFIRNHAVDEVVVFLPLKSFYNESLEIVRCCEEQGIIVRFPSDLFDLTLGHSKTDSLEGEGIISIYTGRMRGWPFFVKGILDFSLSLLLLVFLSPLFLIVSLLIKFTSPGPVFFVQERVGQNKRRFRLYKFRTMFADAEKKIGELEELNEVSGPVFKIKDDPRITWVGKYLRKTSIDELPQLVNVLKGDMSLVGPRPLPVRDYEGFDQDWQRRRFSVRPGITCLWQIRGRSSITFEKWMELDMDYIDNWSLGLDLRIMLETVPAVLKGYGAS